MKKDQIIQIAIAVVVIGLAIVRLVFHGSLSTRMDPIFLILIGSGALLLLIPIRSLKSFKAGGLEFSLDQPQVQGAIAGLSLDRIKNKTVKEQLSKLSNQLPAIRGSRVLWIDDFPHTVIGERRLLRALGVEVVSAISSEEATRMLEADNDFDLIITDVQREGDSYRVTGGRPIHDGVNFIVQLKTTPRQDPIIQKMPVVFYAAYDWDHLVEFTRPARQLYPAPEISKSEDDLIPKVVKLLAESRSAPIPGSKEKVPTPLRRSIRPVASGKQTEEGESSGGAEEEHFG